MALGIPTTLALSIYAFAASANEGEAPLDKWEVLAIGLLTAAAAFAVGALLGFLFGIPRSIATSSVGASKQVTGTQAATASEEVAATQHFAANTNLEQISDWLTKILVGVGLVQIHEISGAVEDLADGLAPGLGPQGFSIAVALLVAYPIIGFVSAYLFTRLRLQGAFEVASLVTLVTERANKETSAIALVQQQLTVGVEKPKLDELVKALTEATTGVRSQAFFLARRQRLENWAGEGSDEEKAEFSGLSGPIFEALIECDTEKHYYRPWAELAYVRLTLEPPQYATAKLAFDQAIEIRPAHLLPRTPGYEFGRAYCTIELDPDFKAGKPSKDPTVEDVCTDLEAVVDFLESVDDVRHDTVKRWLHTNSGKKRVAALEERFKKVGKNPPST